MQWTPVLDPQYWIPSVLTQVKLLFRKCTKCRRDSGPSYQYPAPLSSADRIQEQRKKSFSIRSIIFLRCDPRHYLEFVEDLTAGSFINALRRFTGHYPLPCLIYSDNASTFVNASSLLLKLFNHPKVQEELAAMRIILIFIPKAALWYGGW